MSSTATPLISVISASYNALDGVRATVESVASQLGGIAAEHIIVDGGSDDGTREYLTGLGDAVRWVSEPDDGIGDALNKGVSMAKGEWILVLQAEDTFCTETSLKEAVSAFDPSADIMSFDVLVTSDDGSVRRFASKGMDWLARFHMRIPHQGIFCRKAVFDQLGPFDTSFRIAMDYEFLLRAHASGKKLVSHNMALSRMPDSGVSSQRDWGSLRGRLAENKRLQQRHNHKLTHRILHQLYWSIYPVYKRLRHKEAWRD